MSGIQPLPFPKLVRQITRKPEASGVQSERDIDEIEFLNPPCMPGHFGGPPTNGHMEK